MIETIITLVSGVIGAIIGAIVTYILGKKQSNKQLKAILLIAKKLEDQVDNLRAQLELQEKAIREWRGIQEKSLEQKNMELEWKKTKDILTGLWEGFKYVTDDDS